MIFVPNRIINVSFCTRDIPNMSILKRKICTHQGWDGNTTITLLTDGLVKNIDMAGV